MRSWRPVPAFSGSRVAPPGCRYSRTSIESAGSGCLPHIRTLSPPPVIIFAQLRNHGTPPYRPVHLRSVVGFGACFVRVRARGVAYRKQRIDECGTRPVCRSRTSCLLLRRRPFQNLSSSWRQVSPNHVLCLQVERERCRRGRTRSTLRRVSRMPRSQRTQRRAGR